MAFDLIGKAVKILRLPTVDYESSPVIIIPAQKGDVNSRYFIVQLYDDRGNIDIKPYSVIMLNATLPDGSSQVSVGEVNKSIGTMTCKISGSMLSLNGKVTCDISVQGVDENGDDIFLTSQTFYIFVANSQNNGDAIEGDDDYSLLMQLISNVTQLESNLEKKEENRITAEALRVAAENDRKSSESARVANEEQRQSAEGERVDNESTRISNESMRVENENSRKSAEAARATAEDVRDDNESKRIESESARKTAEVSRVLTEEERVSAESERTANEIIRQGAEESRVNAENLRVSSETSRKTQFDETISECDAATERAQNIVDTVLSTLDALPASTEIKDGKEVVAISLLSFVKLEGSNG